MISTRSVRFRLLAAVNAAIALLFGVFLAVDYHRQIAEGVSEKHIALEEETKTLLPAVMRLAPYGNEAVQHYIDDVCGRMRDATSPGHHIAVRLDATVLQSLAHHRASEEMFAAMETAAQSATHRASLDGEELVVGSSRQDGEVVYVSEYLSSIRQSARRQVLRRLPRIALLVVVTAVVVNVVFLRMAARPLRQLVDTVGQIGEGNLGVQTGPLAADEFSYLAGAINTMSRSLAGVEQRRRDEMARARAIQQQLLPGELSVPGLEFACLYRPAEDVAGDYYDVISLADGTCLVSIADVTGHGVPAALSAAMLKAHFLDAADRDADPGKILTFINHRLAVVCRTENFASMFVAMVDPGQNALRFASAGHEAGLLLKADDGLAGLSSTGFVLGINEDAVYETQTIKIGPGDRLLLVTDGLAEAMNPRGEQFGRQRLARAFQRCAGVTVQECVDRLDRILGEFCGVQLQNDDRTLLVLEVLAQHAAEQQERPREKS